MPKSKAFIGITLALAAGVALSTGGIAVRLIESASGFQVLFYRAVTLCCVMLVFTLLRYRGRTWQVTRDMGVPGLAVAITLGLGAIAYIFAILLTTVANAVVILSTSPLLTALIAWIVLRSGISKITVVASSTALAGVVLMVVDGLDSGGLLGMLIALGAALSYSVMLVVMQRHRDRDMLPAIGLSGIFTMAIAGLAAPDLNVSGQDMAIGIFLGSFQFGLGFALVTLATRYVDGATVALLTLSEVVLAPLWVWLGVGEAPTLLAMVGGLIVLGSVAFQALTVRV